MIPLPSPLHPAVVHFPIVLILAGTAVAFVALFLRRWHLPWLAALLLLTGAAGAIAATITGGQEEEMVGELPPAAEQVLEAHEEWGETTRNLAIVAALLATVAAATAGVRMVGRGFSAVAVVCALAATYSVAQTGHYGGQLVYRHGVGLNTAAAGAAGEVPPPAAEGTKEDGD